MFKTLINLHPKVLNNVTAKIPLGQYVVTIMRMSECVINEIQYNQIKQTVPIS